MCIKESHLREIRSSCASTDHITGHQNVFAKYKCHCFVGLLISGKSRKQLQQFNIYFENFSFNKSKMVGCVLTIKHPHPNQHRSTVVEDANGNETRDRKQFLLMPVMASPPRSFFYHFSYNVQQQQQSDNQIASILKKLLFDIHPLRSVSQDPIELARSIDSKVNQLSIKEKMDVLNEYQLMVNSRPNRVGQSALGLLDHFFRSGNSKGTISKVSF